jgi:hypothetical protein
MCAGLFSSFQSVLPLEVLIINKGRYSIQFNGLSRHIFVCPKPGHTFLISRGLFMLSNLRREVIVRFVDIGGTIDHH